MIKPMLCVLQDKPFNDERYLWEVKFDGIRCLARTDISEYTLQARSGADKTHLFPDLHLLTRAPAILDGELVCYAPDGSQRFNLMQHRMNRVNGIKTAANTYPVTYEVFDILDADGVDLTCLPLYKRKEILQTTLITTPNVKIAKFVDDGLQLFEQVKQVVTGTERGVIGKPKASFYVPGNRGQWIKVKAWEVATFTICGFTVGTGWRAPTFGAIVLARGTPPYYAGMAGTGFNRGQIAELDKQMRSLIIELCPIVGWDDSEPVTWIMPKIQAKIQYLEYTNDGRLRFPSFKGIVEYSKT